MSNNVAVDMYKQLGYVIYRRVLEYYSGDPDEDAYGERHFLFLVVYLRPLALKMCLYAFLLEGNVVIHFWWKFVEFSTCNLRQIIINSMLLLLKG